jgi:hypothetical protein
MGSRVGRSMGAGWRPRLQEVVVQAVTYMKGYGIDIAMM